MKVLLVEDNPVFRKSFSGMLLARFPQMQIQETFSPNQAVNMVHAQMPDLVFLDIQLPEQSGLELARRIKNMLPSCYIVMLTSHDLPEYREAALRSGADCFICKDKAGLLEIQNLVLALCAAGDQNRNGS